MKKAIRILAIIAASVMGLAVLAFLACLVLQRSLAGVYQYPAEIMGMLPVIPLGNTVYLLGLAAVTGVLCFTADNRKTGIWPEILFAALIGAALPALRSVISLAQSAATNRFGANAAIALSAANNLCAIPVAVAGVAASLALLVCGMSIVFKRTR